MRNRTSTTLLESFNQALGSLAMRLYSSLSNNP
nr:MAG TPA: hypothetical protein [Caudoviricetes sp.]